MSLSDAVKSCFSKYATFSGRAPRSEYWWFILFYYIAGFFTEIVFSAIGYACGDTIGMFTAFYVGIAFLFICFFLPLLSVLVRRLHDTGHSGFWYFICLVPLIGGLWLLYLMLKGSDEENQYGLPVY